jgi:hypothetical protein
MLYFFLSFDSFLPFSGCKYTIKIRTDKSATLFYKHFNYLGCIYTTILKKEVTRKQPPFLKILRVHSHSYWPESIGSYGSYEFFNIRIGFYLF